MPIKHYFKRSFVKDTFSNAKETLWRFPLVLVFASIGVIASILELENFKFVVLEKLILACTLAIPFFFSIALIAQSLNCSKKKTLLLRLVGIGLWLGYFFYLSNKPTQWQLLQAMVLNIGLHFFVAVAPFLKSRDESSFWLFNQTLFQRFSLAALYSIILFLGLFIALLSIRHLFDLNFDEKRYPELWLIIVGLFNTWFFLAGVPKQFTKTLADDAYPKGLRAISQYTFIPLSLLYLTILYAYSFKIVLAWSLPKGWVSYLILCFSILAILSVLLVHPIKKNKNFGLIHFFSKYLYFSIIPLTILLFTAIGKRVSDYGITEPRYLVLALAIWLLLVTLVQIFKRGQAIRFIPLSLSVLALIASFGPFSAHRMAWNSQLSQLKTLIKQKDTWSSTQQKQVRSILQYFDKKHSIKALAQALQVTPQENSRQSLAQALDLNLKDKNPSHYVHCSLQSDATMPVENFEHIAYFKQAYRRKNNSAPIKLGTTFALNFNDDHLHLTYAKEKTVLAKHSFTIDDLFSPSQQKSFKYTNTLAVEDLQLDFENEHVRLRIIFINIALALGSDMYIDNADGLILWSPKT